MLLIENKTDSKLMVGHSMRLKEGVNKIRLSIDVRIRACGGATALASLTCMTSDSLISPVMPWSIQSLSA